MIPPAVIEYNIFRTLMQTSVPAPNERMIPMSAVDKVLKEEYIKEIFELLKKCNDPSLLDLIYQLLKKRSAQF